MNFHPKNLVVALTQNLLKSDLAQKVVQGKLILADSRLRKVLFQYNLRQNKTLRSQESAKISFPCTTFCAT
jgi:hypothetical protein